MNLSIIINSAYQDLKKSNIKSALIDSEILLSQAINKNREFIILNSNYNVSDSIISSKASPSKNSSNLWRVKLILWSVTLPWGKL